MTRKIGNRKQRRAAVRDGYRFGMPRPSREAYAKYLCGKWWRQKRRQKLDSVSDRCERCGARNRLHVHHRHYLSLGRERNADLEVLCEVCHRLEHPGWIN